MTVFSFVNFKYTLTSHKISITIATRNNHPQYIFIIIKYIYNYNIRIKECLTQIPSVHEEKRLSVIQQPLHIFGTSSKRVNVPWYRTPTDAEEECVCLRDHCKGLIHALK